METQRSCGCTTSAATACSRQPTGTGPRAPGPSRAIFRSRCSRSATIASHSTARATRSPSGRSGQRTPSSSEARYGALNREFGERLSGSRLRNERVRRAFTGARGGEGSAPSPGSKEASCASLIYLGRWQPVVTVSRPTRPWMEPLRSPSGRRGDTVVVWPARRGPDEVVEAAFLAYRPGTWSGPVELGVRRPTFETPQGAVDLSGNADVAWVGPRGVETAFRSYGSGAWSRPVPVSMPSVAPFDLGLSIRAGQRRRALAHGRRPRAGCTSPASVRRVATAGRCLVRRVRRTERRARCLRTSRCRLEPHLGRAHHGGERRPRRTRSRPRSALRSEGGSARRPGAVLDPSSALGSAAGRRRALDVRRRRRRAGNGGFACLRSRRPVHGHIYSRRCAGRRLHRNHRGTGRRSNAERPPAFDRGCPERPHQADVPPRGLDWITSDHVRLHLAAQWEADRPRDLPSLRASAT